MTNPRDQAALNHARSQQFPAAKPSGTKACPLKKRLVLGVFFDGTNNNMYRDAPSGRVTNVVRLFRLYNENDDARTVRTKKYIVGVGELDMGKRTKQAGGEAVVLGGFFGGVGVGVAAGRYVGHMGSNVAGLAFGKGGMERLNIAYAWAKAECKKFLPEEEKIIDVYGFSRGASLARTFTNLVNQGLAKEVENVSMRFVGIFDTVGSFGMPGDDSNPNQNLGIDGTDAQDIAHFTARHEIRKNFPLSTCKPFDRDYPGVHSDIGGGYLPVDKEKKVNHIAYVPFADMHKESVKNGVELGPWQPVAQAAGVNVEELRAKGEKYASAGASMYDPNSAYARERGEFHKKYMHVSHAEWRTGNTVNPDAPDPSGRRKHFTHKKLKLVAMPPRFKWK
jgi:uncharacterized protein (DUF2235 family)